MTTSSHAQAPARTAQPAQPFDSTVEHLFFVDHMLAANALGVDMRALCGVWESSEGGDGKNLVQDVGGLVPLFEPEDCPRCAEGLAATYAARLGRENAS